MIFGEPVVQFYTWAKGWSFIAEGIQIWGSEDLFCAVMGIKWGTSGDPRLFIRGAAALPLDFPGQTLYGLHIER